MIRTLFLIIISLSFSLYGMEKEEPKDFLGFYSRGFEELSTVLYHNETCFFSTIPKDVVKIIATMIRKEMSVGYAFRQSVKDHTLEDILSNSNVYINNAPMLNYWFSGRDAQDQQKLWNALEELSKEGLGLSSFYNFKLYRCALNNNWWGVQSMLEEGADCTIKYDCNSTPLHVAAEKGSSSIIKLLVNKKADIEAKDGYGATPLFVAVQHGNLAAAKTLACCGAEKNTFDFDGWSALRIAAQKGHLEIVQFLFSSVSDVKSRESAYLSAAYGGHEEIVSYFLEKGVALNATDDRGCTALHHASLAGYTSIVKLLLDRGIDKTYKTHGELTALDYAARNKRDEIELLLKNE